MHSVRFRLICLCFLFNTIFPLITRFKTNPILSADTRRSLSVNPSFRLTAFYIWLIRQRLFQSVFYLFSLSDHLKYFRFLIEVCLTIVNISNVDHDQFTRQYTIRVRKKFKTYTKNNFNTYRID